MKYILGICLILLFSSCMSSWSHEDELTIEKIEFIDYKSDYRYRIYLYANGGFYIYSTDSTLKPGDKVKIVRQ